jgi:hypothetical protein
MGVNILIYKITGTEEVEDYGKITTLFHTEKAEWFDSLRYAGDRDFILFNRFHYIENSDREYCRPDDFKRCKRWIIDNISIGSQPRLLEAMERMEADENLVFRWSW